MKKKNCFRLKSLIGYIALLSTLVIYTGCETTKNSARTAAPAPQAAPLAPSTPPPTSAPTLSRDQQIAQILALKASGALGDADAARLLSALAAEMPVTTGTPAAPVTPAPVREVRKVAANGLMSYEPEFTLTGRLRSVGSDSMDKLVALWEADFMEYHPSLRVQHEGRGSSTAIPAILEGRAEIGPMSRPVKPAEIEQFRSKFGYDPTVVRVALDSLAVYLHPENPILQKGLTMAELDAIFSSTRLQGHPSDISTWGQLGLTGEWQNAPIRVYSRNRASGTYGFFKDTVLKGGDFKPTNFELPGSAEVVKAVGADKFAIGYSGIGYITPEVRAAKVAKDIVSPKIEANQQNALSGSYPLSRFLYLVVNVDPTKGGELNTVEFMRFILSAEGQDLVAKDGYFPLDQRILNEELAKFE